MDILATSELPLNEARKRLLMWSKSFMVVLCAIYLSCRIYVPKSFGYSALRSSGIMMWLFCFWHLIIFMIMRCRVLDYLLRIVVASAIGFVGWTISRSFPSLVAFMRLIRCTVRLRSPNILDFSYRSSEEATNFSITTRFFWRKKSFFWKIIWKQLMMALGRGWTLTIDYLVVFVGSSQKMLI